MTTRDTDPAVPGFDAAVAHPARVYGAGQHPRGGQSLNPAARIVYADNDPLVLTHARALLTGTPGGNGASRCDDEVALSRSQVRRSRRCRARE